MPGGDSRPDRAHDKILPVAWRPSLLVGAFQKKGLVVGGCVGCSLGFGGVSVGWLVALSFSRPMMTYFFSRSMMMMEPDKARRLSLQHRWWREQVCR